MFRRQTLRACGLRRSPRADTTYTALPTHGPRGWSKAPGTLLSLIHEQLTHLNPQAAVLASLPHDPTGSPTTTPLSRRDFATVSRAAQQLPPRERIPRRCSKLAGRGLSAARRAPGCCVSPNHLSPLYAQQYRASSWLISLILRMSHSKKHCVNLQRYAALKGCCRRRVRFHQIPS